MAISFYHNGIGGSTGDSLALASPLMTSGNIWYVDSATGTDAASPAGQNREKPLDTLAQAVTNAADDDIIVFLDGHAETLTAAQTISKRLTLVGEGSSSGVPTVTFTRDVASGTGLFVVSGTNVQIRNIKFAADSQTNATARITCSAAKTTFIDCYFVCSGTSTWAAVQLDSGTTHPTFRGCTFISTATAVATQPESAIKSTVAIADMVMVDCVFSAGTVGFSNFYAVDFSTAACTRMAVENISLLLGADIKFHASSTGYVNVATATGGSKVVW